MMDILEELKPINDMILARKAKIDNYKELMESDQYREQEIRLTKLMNGALKGLQASWLMSTRSQKLSDNTLTFRFIDDAIFSVYGIANSIKHGAHNPARREMRYLLESVCKHHYVDTNPTLSGKNLSERLNELENNVSRSTIEFVGEQLFFSLDEHKSKELASELKDIYSQCCKFVHRSRDQIDLYLMSVEKGSSPGYESVKEFSGVNREFARLCDMVLFLTLSILGPSGLAGDLFVQVFDGDNTWPYHKTKYIHILSKYYDYKMERNI
jgi:hypothetical protein